MIVIEAKPVPVYRVTCDECKSVIQYKASEISCCHITCPVCGMSVWADKTDPVCENDPMYVVTSQPFKPRRSKK